VRECQRRAPMHCCQLVNVVSDWNFKVAGLQPGSTQSSSQSSGPGSDLLSNTLSRLGGGPLSVQSAWGQQQRNFENRLADLRVRVKSRQNPNLPRGLRRLIQTLSTSGVRESAADSGGSRRALSGAEEAPLRPQPAELPPGTLALSLPSEE
jgi:hypothetical protein